MRLEMYSPCDVCGNKCENDMSFHKWQEDRSSWLQYSLCNKHLPKSPRVFIWMHNLRVGRAVASFLGLGIGLGGCYKCGTPWDCIRSHSTRYNPGSACFPLCEPCWQELTPTDRLPFYLKLLSHWDATPERYCEVIQAVLEGK